MAVRYEIEKLLGVPFYTEGPVRAGNGDMFFTTLSGGYVGKLDDRGGHTVWTRLRYPNGQVILTDGSHLVCNSQEASIKKFDSTGDNVGTEIWANCAAIPIVCPNDLVTDSRGNLYLPDSLRATGKVFFKDVAGEEQLVAANLDFPNGLALSKDEKWLFVAESYRNRILKLTLSHPGIMKGIPAVLANLPGSSSGKITDNLPDGLALDREGRLWVAHYGMGQIQVLSTSGQLLFSLDTELPLTSNLCFLAEKKSTKVLLVTGGYGEPGPGALLRIKVIL